MPRPSRMTSVTAILEVLLQRQGALVALAEDPTSPMEIVDRENILNYFVEGSWPDRPQSVEHVTRYFMGAAFTYSVVRNFLRARVGYLGSGDWLSTALRRSFDEPRFMEASVWEPVPMGQLARELEKRLDPKSPPRAVPRRIVEVLKTGSAHLERELAEGVEPFCDRVDQACESGPVGMWRFVSEFSAPVRFVGPALTCAFLKDIGFVQFVKVDHHIEREFPDLIGHVGCGSLSTKDHFRLSIELGEQIGMTPFHIDHLLYQWGRYKGKVGAKPR